MRINLRANFVYANLIGLRDARQTEKHSVQPDTRVRSRMVHREWEVTEAAKAFMPSWTSLSDPTKR
jgi:hypothetical protein